MILLAKKVRGVQTRDGGVHRLSPSHSHFTILWVCVYVVRWGHHDMCNKMVKNGVKKLIMHIKINIIILTSQGVKCSTPGADTGILEGGVRHE